MSVLSRRFWSEGPGSFALALGLALFVRWALFEAYVIPSGSMLPSLLINDHIFVNKVVYGVRFPFSERWFVRLGEPRRGDVVVFKLPTAREKYYIKRIVGLPGDQVLVENGHVYINGKPLERSIPQGLRDDGLWLRDADFPGEAQAGGRSLYVHWEEHVDAKTFSVLVRRESLAAATFGPVTVPDDEYFVLGDNRDNSQDSRTWDAEQRFVPRGNLVGRASVVWLSCETTLPVLTFLCNPLTVRWQRLLHAVN